ncbi:hypothetical protein SAMN05216330_104101 [Bradyrhizobium sp. Ghvi]|nr:hypothetical protein SAMN05216330_104101 [Bradyrhizobium sp. Ghvi]
MPHQRGMNPCDLMKDTRNVLASSILGRPQRQDLLLHFIDFAIDLRKPRLDRFQNLEHQLWRHLGQFACPYAFISMR